MPITILFERTCIVVFVCKFFKSLTITCKQTFEFRHFDLKIYLLLKFQPDINDTYIFRGNPNVNSIGRTLIYNITIVLRILYKYLLW